MDHKAVSKAYAHMVDVVKSPSEWAATMFTPDATFCLGNFPTSVGHDQIAAAAGGVYNMCVALKHVEQRLHSVSDDCFITEGSVTYTMADGRTLSPIPLTSVFDLSPGTCLIANYRAYLDISPLFSANGLVVTVGQDGVPGYAPPV